MTGKQTPTPQQSFREPLRWPPTGGRGWRPGSGSQPTGCWWPLGGPWPWCCLLWQVPSGQGAGTLPQPSHQDGSGQPAGAAHQPCPPPPGPAGIAHPSAFSSAYFLLFLAICTWWACHFPISPLGFSALCVTVGCFGAGHLVCLYCYQTPYAQVVLPPAGIWAR